MEENIVTEIQEINEAAANPTEKNKNKPKENIKKHKPRKSQTGVLKVLQHIVISAVAVALLIVLTGSTVSVQMYNRTETYKLSPTDENRKYDDSVLFNTILGNEVSDIFRLVTIRTQMETQGNYNPEKIIDVTAFNNRLNYHNNTANEVSAKYYLGDLLKWSRYGFEYEDITQAAMDDDASALASNPYDGTGTPDSSYDNNIEYSMLINRYNTTNGKTPQEIARTWSEYYNLTNQLEICANDLYSNYTEYLSLTDYFNPSASNMKYCVTIGEGKNRTIYSNDDIIKSDDKSIAKTFKGYGKYIFFDSENMVYETNTAITESTFNSLISKYEYVFADDCKIYIAVDTTMPALDSIKTGSKGFNNYLPYYKQFYLTIALGVILYIALLILCTIKEGREISPEGKKTIRQTDFDNTAIELWLVLTFIVLIAIPYVTYAILYTQVGKFFEIAYEPNFRILLAIIVFLYDILILTLYYSFVRRVKGANIWKHSLAHRICELVKKSIISIYDNGNLILRSWVPYCALIIINVFLLALTFGFNIVVCLILVILVDALAGYALYSQVKDRTQIIDGMKQIISGDLSYKADEQKVHGDNVELATCVNSISDAVRNAVEKSTRDERMKTDLIANVSHDIRTPLTSIISYVDLIKRENIADEKILSYVNVIDEKSQRLKHLTDDLIEASKASSGNVELELVKMNVEELLTQAIGEFVDKFEEKGLTSVINNSELAVPTLMADGKSLYRVIENLLGNIYKYAMPNTRVFIDLFNASLDNKQVIVMNIRNMSQEPLPEDLSELTERFIRGDSSRTTEGSGLGLSIAKSLTELMGGVFELSSDADLFKVQLIFEAAI